MTARSFPLWILIILPSWLLVVACADDPSPRPPGGQGPSPTGHSTTAGDADAGDDAISLIDDETTADVDDDDHRCTIDLPLPGDERYPCCFSDADCATSTSPWADDLRCYHAECTDGGWGTCRRPPPSPATNECWDDGDCPIGQTCAFDPDLDVSCTEPGTQEVWDICI